MINTPSPVGKFFDIVKLKNYSMVGVLNGTVENDSEWYVIGVQNKIALLVNPKGCIKTPVSNLDVLASFDPQQVLQDVFEIKDQNPQRPSGNSEKR